MKTLGQRIHEAAEKIGGIGLLAEAADTKPTTLRDYANGRTEPKVSTLLQIAEATDISVLWLITGQEPKKRTKTLAQRIQDIADRCGGLIPLARVSGVSSATLKEYLKDGAEYKITTLVKIAKAGNVPIEWLIFETSAETPAESLDLHAASIEDIETYIQAIAATLWEKAPTHTSPDDFANQFLDVFKRLMAKDGLTADDISGAVKFAIAELDTGANEDKRKK